MRVRHKRGETRRVERAAQIYAAARDCSLPMARYETHQEAAPIDDAVSEQPDFVITDSACAREFCHAIPETVVTLLIEFACRRIDAMVHSTSYGTTATLRQAKPIAQRLAMHIAGRRETAPGTWVATSRMASRSKGNVREGRPCIRV